MVSLVRHRLEQELGVHLSLASLLERTTAAEGAPPRQIKAR